MKNKLNNLIEEIVNSPLVAYYKIYNSHNLNNLYETIKSVSEKKNISDFEVIISMETFANIYELFRPCSITNYDYYWGSVKTMDGIYSTLYRYLESENLRRFSKAFYYIDYEIVKKIPCEDILWERLLEDIEYIINVIKKTIGREALKLYRISDSDSLCYKYEIIDYIRLLKGNHDLKIEFLNEPYKKIIIDGREVLIDKSQSLFSLEDEIFHN